LIIFEPQAIGHHMHYVRHVAKEALKRDHNVKLATFQSSLEHPATAKLMEECGLIETVILSEDEENYWRPRISDDNPVKRKLSFHRMFVENYRKLCVSKDDIVFVPFLDYVDYAMAVLGSPFGESRWGGLVFCPEYYSTSPNIIASRSRLNWLRKLLLNSLLEKKSMKALFTINSVLYSSLSESAGGYGQKLWYVPEPVEFTGSGERGEARRRLKLSAEGTVILVYGELSPRKGIGALLSATRHPMFPEDVRILLAGPQDVHTRRMLSSPVVKDLRREGRLHEINRYLTGQDEYDVFKAADIVWLGYRGFYGRSAVLFQAGRMGLPVIACKSGEIGFFTRKYGLGLTVNVGDRRDVAEAVTSLVQDKALADGYGRKGVDFSEDHTADRFAKIICDGLGL